MLHDNLNYSATHTSIFKSMHLFFSFRHIFLGHLFLDSWYLTRLLKVMSIYSVIWHFIFVYFDIFATLNKRTPVNQYTRLSPFFEIFPTKSEVTSLLKNCYQICNQHVKNSQKWPPQKNLKKCPKWGLNSWPSEVMNGALLYAFLRLGLYKTGSCRLILLISNSKHRVKEFYMVSKFKENVTKIGTMRVPQRKRAR